jgi:hypothetical protein
MPQLKNVSWDVPAQLQVRQKVNAGFAWVGKVEYDGTVAGAVRAFKGLPLEAQKRCDLFTNSGVIGGSSKSLLGYEELSALAARSDIPER